ncbi:hypothetical protein BT96DRAFT_921151 [Gymnopus androsaceus JB14]|uniref:Ubiquitin 3 binding protein But2 C-terminal domain-containing protein n=1 Tax=Gymnopus androsaceus JB14 TaxID=1447944 RepID=A0A6A4HLL0_9AGAR|nr:hypothetical protein BT96DRAFT_921151 [Gymnopus androsaceus JB14]
MSFAKIFLLSPVLFWIAGVGAVPAPASILTLYDAVPTEMFPPTLTISATESTLSGFTQEIDVSTLGVSTGSEDTETTYSMGVYVSIPATTVTAAATTFTVPATTVTAAATTFSVPAMTETDGATTFSLPANVFTNNYTLVESSGGFQLSFSSYASGTGQGFYETCTFDANGGVSASCIEIDYLATSSGSLEASTSSFEAFKTPLVGLPVPTSSSNTAISTSQGSYWKMGYYASMFCVVVLVV